ncbi:adenylyl-sulfate kinase [Tahibacter harae]|uniref:Adenylyl-sulfate kinase n=1 Tax=Tahibacter harae TaxID=2963937 RepID=A0ABT1QUD1_9GAMM|nr:adenylyl-sulfate kinase [Tahibacter harae]MCQ4165905.1 adenylyl-sulfate kinase [Tahibacter harae]
MSVLWITGLAGAGKTTLAALVAAVIGSDAAAPAAGVRHFDGDAVRRELGELGRGYTREQRLAVARHIAGLAIAHSRRGGCAVVSTISLFHTVHAHNRAAGVDYFEVLLDCAGETREQRLAARGLQGPRVGAEIAAEFPLAPHLRLDSGRATPPRLAQQLLQAWRRRHV